MGVVLYNTVIYHYHSVFVSSARYPACELATLQSISLLNLIIVVVVGHCANTACLDAFDQHRLTTF